MASNRRLRVWLLGLATCWLMFGFIKYLVSRNVMQSPFPDLKMFYTDTWSRQLVLIYNRVPKTGSTSFVNIAYKLYGVNNFSVLHVNATNYVTRLSVDEQQRFAHNVTSWSNRMPAIYHGHFAFIDVATHDAAFAEHAHVLYINVVREPLARLISYYFFIRFGDDFRPHVLRSRMSATPMSFDECVRVQEQDCAPERMWLQVPYFCGQHAFCTHPPGNSRALRQAKFNLLNKYFLVGVTENLTAFVQTVESALPSMFQGGEEVFTKESHMRRTRKKMEPSNETITVLKQHPIYKAEKEFYDLAKELFHRASRRILAHNFSLANGWLAKDFHLPNDVAENFLSELPSGNTISAKSVYQEQFFYEKIKPA